MLPTLLMLPVLPCLKRCMVNRFDKFEASYSQQEGNKPYSARGVRFTPRDYGRIQGNPPQRRQPNLTGHIARLCRSAPQQPEN